MSYLTDLYAGFVERDGASIGVTLVVDGLVISGTMVRRIEFYEWTNRQVHRALVKGEFPVEHADDFRQLEAANVFSAEEQEEFPEIHLRDVQIISSADAEPVDLPYLAVAARAVSACTLAQVRIATSQDM